MFIKNYSTKTLLVLCFLSSCSSISDLFNLNYRSPLKGKKINVSASTFQSKNNWKETPQVYGEKLFSREANFYFSVPSVTGINQNVACRDLKDSLGKRLSEHFIGFFVHGEDKQEEWVLYLNEIIAPKVSDFFSRSKIIDTNWEYGKVGDDDMSTTYAFVCYGLVKVKKTKVLNLIGMISQRVTRQYLDNQEIEGIAEAWARDYSEYHTREF